MPSEPVRTQRESLCAKLALGVATPVGTPTSRRRQLRKRETLLWQRSVARASTATIRAIVPTVPYQGNPRAPHGNAHARPSPRQSAEAARPEAPLRAPHCCGLSLYLIASPPRYLAKARPRAFPVLTRSGAVASGAI